MVRLHLSRPTSGPSSIGRFEPVGSPESLAPLMLAAYRGTPDDEGETLEDTVEVLRHTMAGGWGPWLPDASFVALDDDGPVGAALTALEDGRPFIAFLFTRPDRTRRGVATDLVARVCEAVRATGEEELALWVSTDNEAAVRLYAGLGFTPVQY